MPKPNPAMPIRREDRARVDRSDGDDQERAAGECDGAGARADPGRRAAEGAVERAPRSRRGRRCRSPDDDQLLVAKSCAPSSGPSEKKRPPIDQEASTASDATRNGWRTTGGMLGRSRVRRKRRRFEHGLRHPVDADERDREQDEQQDVRQHRGAEPSWTSDAGRGSRGKTRRARDGVREPTLAGISAWVQVEERRARRTDRGTGREALYAAADEEPGGRVGEHEQHGRERQDAERNEQTGRRPTSSDARPASSSVASTPNAYVAKIKVSVSGEKCQSAL